MTENRRRWLGVSLVVGAVVVAIVLLTVLLTSGGRHRDAGAVVPPTPSPTPLATPTASPDVSPMHPSTSTRRVLPLQDPPGYGWGTQATPHHLVLEVSTTARVFAYMAWIVPTAVSSKGLTSMTGTQWSRNFTVYGPPYFAKFYVQYGPNTGGVTCRVVVDGKLRAQHTGFGRYGGVWCIG